jgi:hypothetical protein
MSIHIAHLSDEEKELVKFSPLYVSALIAGADGDFSTDEKKRTFELVHVKTYSAKFGLKSIYQDLDETVEEDLRKLIAILPQDQEERNAWLVNKIAGLNPIFDKVSYTFAHNLYRSLREFAHYVANVDGGFWGIGSVKAVEEVYIKLDMLVEPTKKD